MLVRTLASTLLAAASVSLAALPLHAQSVQVRPGPPAQQGMPSSVCDPCPPGVDLASVAGDANAEHVISADGRYFLRSDVVVGSGRSGIRIDTGVRSVVLELNGYSIVGDGSGNSVDGISQLGPVAPRGHVTILKLHGDGGSIVNFGGSGVHCEGALDVSIEETTIVGCTGPGVSSTRVRALSLDKCVLWDNGTSVFHCGSSLRVTECVDLDSTADGIAVTDACGLPNDFSLNVHLLNTMTLRPVGDGVSVSSLTHDASLRMDGGNLGSSGCDGVSVDMGSGTSGTVVLESCNLGSSGLDGVRVSGGDNGSVAVRLKVSNLGSSGCDGVSVAAGSGGTGELDIIECEISNSLEDGVHMEGGGNGGSLRGRLKISNLGSSGCDGVSIAGGSGGSAELEMEACNLGSSGEDGVRVETAGGGGGGRVSVVLKVSNLGSSGCDGVQISPGGGDDCDFLIEECEIAGSTDNAVLVSSSGRVRGRLKVSNLGSSGCDGVSIDLGGGGEGDIVVEQCVIDDNLFHGIDVTGGGTGSTLRVTESSIGSSGLDGVRVSGGSLYMESCSVRQCGGRGVDVSSAQGACSPGSVLLRDVSVESCTTDGIWISSSTGGRVEGCTASGNGGIGIHVGDVVPGQCCSGVSVRKCSSVSNATGYEVLGGGGHFVLENVASRNLADYLVDPNGNVVGPVQTSQQMLVSPHPQANLH